MIPSKKLTIIAMIPARYQASRFPGKLMQPLGGRTVILRTYQATVETGLFDAVYVVTDSDPIENEIIRHGGQVIRSIGQHESGSDRIAEAAAQVEADIVMNVQGDEPFINRQALQKVLEVYYQPDADQIDLASLMTAIDDPVEIADSNTVKVVVDTNNYARYFSRAPIPYCRDAEIPVTYYKHKGIYAFRKQALLDFTQLPMGTLEAIEKIECLRYLENNRSIKMAIHNEKSVEIDTPQDLKDAEALLKRKG